MTWGADVNRWRCGKPAISAAAHDVMLHHLAADGSGGFTSLAAEASDQFAPVPRAGDDLAAFSIRLAPLAGQKVPC